MERAGGIAIAGTIGVASIATVIVYALASPASTEVPSTVATPVSAQMKTIAVAPNSAAGPQRRAVRAIPTDAEEDRARRILARLHSHHSFLGAVSAFGAATENVSLWLPIPTAEWQRLSTADKSALVRFMNEQPARARSDPGAYTDVPTSAPMYETIVRRISTIRDGEWFIIGGTIVEQGADMDEGNELACGDNYSGCAENLRADALLGKWKR
jgi:hypothetical protein